LVFAATFAALFVGVLAVIGLWGVGPLNSLTGQQPPWAGPGGLLRASPSPGSTAAAPTATWVWSTSS
jgi:hypothetical protein